MPLLLPPYSAHKPSGLEWLPDIPARWRTERGKWLLKKMKRPVRYTDEVVTCFRDGVVTLRKNRRTEGFTESLQEIGYQGIRAGRPCDSCNGCLCPARLVWLIRMERARPSTRYAGQNLMSMPITLPICFARWRGVSGLPRLPQEFESDPPISAMPHSRRSGFPLPPLPEQHAIVRYLDHADRRIQRYIEAKEQLIALLQEARQAIIQRAVTRGLDPDVPLKPSGVDWLGDVPAHWEVVQLGRIGRFSKGSGGTKADEVPEGVPCIRYGDLYTSHKFHIHASRSCVTETDSLNYTPLRYGDILFAGSGETIEEIGKSAVNLIEQPACCGGDVILSDPKEIWTQYSLAMPSTVLSPVSEIYDGSGYHGHAHIWQRTQVFVACSPSPPRTTRHRSPPRPSHRGHRHRHRHRPPPIRVYDRISRQPHWPRRHRQARRVRGLGAVATGTRRAGTDGGPGNHRQTIWQGCLLSPMRR